MRRSWIVDLWSIIHFCFWAFVASSVDAAFSPPLWVHAVYGVVGSYAWEAAEYFLQRRYSDAWSNRVEHPLNSWLTDPLFNLLGVAFGVFVVRWYR